MIQLKISFCLIVLCLLSVHLQAQKTYEYPLAPKDSVVDTYFGESIADPYQWMENPDDERLSAWIKEQQKLTKKLENQQTKVWTLRNQIAAMYYGVSEENTRSYQKVNRQKSEYLFKYNFISSKRSPDLQYRKRGNTNYKTLVKIKDFRKDKDDNVLITDWYVNDELELVAVTVSHSGSDWNDAYFFDLKTGDQLPDTLRFLRSSSNILWHGKGVYYDRYKEPEKGRELLDIAKGQTFCYHKLGDRQHDDKTLYHNPDTSGVNTIRYFMQDRSRIYFYHFYLSKGNLYHAISYSDIKEDHSIFLRNFLIYPENDSVYFTIEEQIGDSVLLRTNHNAPNGKVYIASINHKNQLLNFIPEYDITLRRVYRLGKNKLSCIYRNDGEFVALIFNLKGELLKMIEFPEGEKVNYLYEYDSTVEYTNFCVSSFYHPDIWYQMSLSDLSYKPAMKIQVPYNPEDLHTRYVKYPSKDGTEIPMYITCLKDTELDGDNPVLIYGYGGYGITVEPKFDESQALWLLHGGILAVPNVRGGGAQGSEWGKQGRGVNKQNTIDDFIAAAEYLIDKKYTNPEKLAVYGASHGGMLVGAAITQRPELFKAAVAEAGVYDMIRFEKFTIGHKSTNIIEFGTIDEVEGYQAKKSYSPLHNVRSGVSYPNVLLITGDHDDRVPPLHTYKFLATLQEKGSPQSLYHMYLISGAGHGGALTREDWERKLLYKYYFLFDQMDITFW